MHFLFGDIKELFVIFILKLWICTSKIWRSIEIVYKAG